MHLAAAPRSVHHALIALIVAAGCTLPAARGDTVYVVSKSTGGLFRFDSGDPLGTLVVISGTGTFNVPTALAVGPDGHLYVAEAGASQDVAFVPRIRKVVVSGTTATISTAVSLSGTDTAIYGPSGKLSPAAIAFRRPSEGGEMLVGRNPEMQAAGPVVKVTGWNTPTPVVENFTTGTALASSPGLAVSAVDGSLFVSNSAYGGTGEGIAGTVERFDSAGAFVATVAPGAAVPGALYGPTGLVVAGATLYSASTQNSTIYATNLVSGSTSPLGAIDSAFGFDAGPLARLSSGDLLTGSVIGFNPSLYLIPAAGTEALISPYLQYADFGAVGGIVTMAVPEPTTVALAAAGIAVIVARWRGRRRRVG